MTKLIMSFDEKVIQFFKYADKDNSNSISLDELVQVFRLCGDYRPECQIKELFKFIDTNNDNKVSLEELKTVLAKQPPKQKREFDLRAAFKEIDKDNSGSINIKELQEFLTKNGYDDDVKAVIAAADKNGDGVISFEEFVALIQ
ncbi:calmodulin-like isoform X3 [Biomphalaria glabrata]|uniref:Calmodulin-like isoform X3 n=1 Tax=Biomphalaria glabrata TaxID=6526 RepID=A0A9W3A5F7_BIOGL|nr:calmodulin-like isoform X3 [Biomphalaria glabrata]